MLREDMVGSGGKLGVGGVAHFGAWFGYDLPQTLKPGIPVRNRRLNLGQISNWKAFDFSDDIGYTHNIWRLSYATCGVNVTGASGVPPSAGFASARKGSSSSPWRTRRALLKTTISAPALCSSAATIGCT